MSIILPNIRFNISASSKVLPDSGPITNLDSLKIVELLAILSEDYNLLVTEDDAMNFHTYKDLFDFTQG